MPNPIPPSTGTRSNRKIDYMLDRVADYIRKVITPVSRGLGGISMVVIALVTLLVVADVILRRLFNSPIKASHDFLGLGFSMIVFLPLAWSALNNRHIELDLITKRLPKTAQSILEVVMVFITTVVLGVLSWQLLALGIKLQDANAITAMADIPKYPFVYLAAFGCLLFTLAFFIRLLNAINNLRGERK